ncbi:tellurite resistance TerB family protein [Rhizobium rhizogenes]|uniref:tellurite resistance TerB family protein n=1 Tax=Rhizobium rhizogenes TaxID=359 RepID=UPI00157484E3|nr:tellurite resistance TerB family protein [Rhizobium rhizogenes]NTF43290.1 tellurite resistance TerB family protein [Rhizobium rhizogenes]
MIDARKLLDQFLGSQVPGLQGSVKDKATQAINLARDNPMATSAIAGVLLGTKTGRQIAGNTLALGGLAAIAGLGYQAYKNYRDGNQPQPAPQSAPQSEPQFLPPPSNSGFSTAPAIASNDFTLSLVRAMIAAARADGHIDDTERQRILGKVQESGVGSEAEAFFQRELANPVDLDAIVASAQTEEQRVQIYTASRLAIEPDSRAERGYLDLLAGRLGLADPLVDHIEATVAGAKVQL